jgi:2-dehydropantoate 2-reductase
MTTGILIVGSGALATLFAAQLSAAGIEVMMLGTWQEGLAALNKSGAILEGKGIFKVRATDNPDDCKGAEIALVLVKSWQTERAANQLADCMGKNGLAVTFQNGLGNDDILAGILGRQRVSRGVTTLGAALVAPGTVRSNGRGEITLEAHARLSALETKLRVAQFDIKVVEDLQPMVWGKLVINAAINPLTALLRVKNGELLSTSTARELMGNLACETASVAKAFDVELPFSVPERAVEDVAKNTADNISSMLQDILRGAPTEVDVINGMVIRLGKQKNVPTLFNQVVWSLVKALPHPGKL